MRARERAAAGTTGDALTSFLQSLKVWGALCYLPQGQLGTHGGSFGQEWSSASAASRLLLEIFPPLWPLTFEAERRKVCPRASHKQTLGTNP